MLQFCVTQSHVKQRAIAKKSSLLSQHETPPQSLNATGRSWSCGFQGTEQRMKGNSSHLFLARAACLPDPLLQDAFKPDNLMFYISAEKLSISTKYTSGYLSVRCGILSTSYFRSRTGWVYHQIRIAKICSSWIPRIFWPLLTFQPFCPGDKDWNFFHFMIILTTVTRTMFQDPIVVIKKNLNKIRSQKWMAFIITSIWIVQHPRLGPTFSYGEWSLSFHGDEHLKAHW